MHRLPAGLLVRGMLNYAFCVLSDDGSWSAFSLFHPNLFPFDTYHYHSSYKTLISFSQQQWQFPIFLVDALWLVLCFQPMMIKTMKNPFHHLMLHCSNQTLPRLQLIGLEVSVHLSLHNIPAILLQHHHPALFNHQSYPQDYHLVYHQRDKHRHHQHYQSKKKNHYSCEDVVWT